MSVLLFAETAAGSIKKSVFEAASYAYDLQQKLGGELQAVAIGNEVDETELKKLGTYGVSKVYHVKSDDPSSFINVANAATISKIAKDINAKAVVFSQTYDGRAISPRVAVKLDAAPLSGVISMVDPGDHFSTSRMSFSGKGVEFIKAEKDKVVITVKVNGYGIVENAVDCTIEAATLQATNKVDAIAKEIVKMSDGISLTEADIVVSAGRGMKGPENWAMIEELASLIGAATACSKPCADMDWRPHHEHVGQTGIQIAPNVYIAIGISGAIQHLAGVSSSKHIIVINKDPEAPFFKIADYGIVGDLFEVVPKLINTIKEAKAVA